MTTGKRSYAQIIAQADAFYQSNLFHDVQMAGLFRDSKTFADALPKTCYATACQAYEQAHITSLEHMAEFVDEHFELPADRQNQLTCNAETVVGYIDALWPKLTCQPDTDLGGSLLPLAHPYLVPGGRFREIYYWDSYFTALGLQVAGKEDLIRHMLTNFIQIQQGIGLIPNGNRSYYASRSQPPVLALMADLVVKAGACPTSEPDDELITLCLRGLKSEYAFWMQGSEQLSARQPAHRRVVRMAGGELLNRYWDDSIQPRPESYREDIEAALGLPANDRGQYYRNIRAACESGWDFSSRWLANPADLTTIQTTERVPIDLNALLCMLEQKLAQLCQMTGDPSAEEYDQAWQRRQQAINTYLWLEHEGMYGDFNLITQDASKVLSLAGAVPLFAGIASQHQASLVARNLMSRFCTPGGLLTTLQDSPQQWDKPNGWAPLHWFCAAGLSRYGFDPEADKVAACWTNTVDLYFASHHTLMEKYNLLDINHAATGGEYEVQHGFGWTNGVTLAFLHRLQDAFPSWPNGE